MERDVDYHEFLQNKRHTAGDNGFEPVWMPDSAFDFQSHIIDRAVRKGRMGTFADTGLGKTLIQVAVAENIVRKTNKRVLILTPLAVAFQFLDEAERIGVDDIAHTKDGKLSSKITVCNYERLHLLDPNDFECVMLDESSILKNFQGATRDAIIAFIKRVRYRFLATATPSPNDFIELGNSSEALGYMGYMDMLGKFFKNNQNSVDSSNLIGQKYPEWKRFIPSDFKWECTINAEDLADAIRTAQLGGDSVRFDAADGEIVIYNDKAEAAVSEVFEGELKAAFFAQYLIDAVVAAGTDDIALQVGAGRGEALINGHLLVMPVKL